jgi:hypothetical protein
MQVDTFSAAVIAINFVYKLLHIKKWEVKIFCK